MMGDLRRVVARFDDLSQRSHYASNPRTVYQAISHSLIGEAVTAPRNSCRNGSPSGAGPSGGRPATGRRRDLGPGAYWFDAPGDPPARAEGPPGSRGAPQGRGRAMSEPDTTAASARREWYWHAIQADPERKQRLERNVELARTDPGVPDDMDEIARLLGEDLAQ